MCDNKLSLSFLMGLKIFIFGAMIMKHFLQLSQFRGKLFFKRGSLKHVAPRVHVVHLLGQSKAKLYICSKLEKLVLGWNLSGAQLKASPNNYDSNLDSVSKIQPKSVLNKGHYFTYANHKPKLVVCQRLCL